MEQGGQESVGTKVWWKHWSAVFLLAALAAFVIWGLIKTGPWLRSFQEKRLAEKDLGEQYKNDKYGGRTPQETLNMFLLALENGDIELASKYFVIEKQGAWAKTLNLYKTQNLLGSFGQELKSEPIDTSMFKLYPSGAWKIREL